jgi:hypothetical protein
MTTFAIVRFRVPGIHYWPGPPKHRQYLLNAHRHLFHVECGIEVKHNDREIEFQDLLDRAQHKFMLGGRMSCEMAAKGLLKHLQKRFPERRMYVDVFEDGECGARITSEGLDGVPNKKRIRVRSRASS